MLRTFLWRQAIWFWTDFVSGPILYLESIIIKKIPALGKREGVFIQTVLRYFGKLDYHEQIVNRTIDKSPIKNILIRQLLILHYKEFLKTSPKNIEFTLFMLVIIIMVIIIMKTNWDHLFWMEWRNTKLNQSCLREFLCEDGNL